MTDSAPAPLEVTVHVDAPPERVFPWFVEPDRYVQWMGAEAELAPSPGGDYVVRVRDGVEARGSFEEVDPPRRVVFTWGWVGDPLVPPGSTRVEVTLAPEDGGTRVVLRHHDLPYPETAAHHRQGWEAYLPRLAAVVVGADPGPDPNAG